MTAAVETLPFDTIVAGRAWYRVDDVYDAATRIHTAAPWLHYDLDCRWSTAEGWQIVTRGGSDIVEQQPFFDTCDRWGAADCPDAPGHARPVAVCPQCASALTGAVA